MGLIKNKRGIDMWWIFLIVAVFVALMSYSVSKTQEKKQIGNYIGEYQFSMISTINDAEKAEFYIHQSAKYSLQQSIYDLAQGNVEDDVELIDTSDSVKEETGCGTFNNVDVWYILKKDGSKYELTKCTDEESFKTKLEYIFNKNLNKYLENYPANLILNNYDYEIRSGIEIVGKAKSQLSFDILKATTAQKKDNKKLGTYYIMPSFITKIDYDLIAEYEKNNNELNQIIEECKASNNIEGCIKSKTLKWNCESDSEEQNILQDFAGKLNECISLNENNAVCRFSLDGKNYVNTQKSIRNFQVVLTKTKVELKEDNKVLARQNINLDNLFYTDFDTKDISKNSADSIVINVKYTNEKPSIEKVAAIKGSSEIELVNKLLFYKTNDEIKFVQKAFDSSFNAPQPANTIIDLPRRKGIKFCAKTGKQVYAYDSSDNQVKLRDIVHKFAIIVPRSAPKPLENLKARDALKAENSAVLTWEGTKETGLKSYSIYLSKKDFINTKMDDIKKDAEIKKLSVPTDNPIKIEYINLEDCDINPLYTKCKYKNYNNLLFPNKLYYFVSDDKYIYVVDGLEDDIEYNFAVAAVNNEDAEIDNDRSIENNIYVFTLNRNYAKFASKDDLPPGKVENIAKEITSDNKVKLKWDLPTINLDGSELKDLAGFNIYSQRYPGLVSNPIPPTINSMEKVSINLNEANCISGKCNYAADKLDKDSQYYIYVSALDEKGNEYRDDKLIVVK